MTTGRQAFQLLHLLNTMTNLIDIQNQIAILQKQAEEIKAKMAAFGITLADLDGGKTRTRKAGAVKSGNPAPAKYRGPNGELWAGGLGRKPQWVAAVLAEGKSLDEFLI